MKVALIGAAGQLGQDLVRSCPEHIELVPLTRGDLDITDFDQCEKVLGEIAPQVVLNSAAYVRVDDCEDQPDDAFAVNAVATQNVARVCRDQNLLLAQVSTDYVFSGDKRDEPWTEEDQPRPINTYGLSKYAGEMAVQYLLDKHYIFRVSSLYGKAGASGKGGNFVYTMLKKAREGAELKVIDDITMSPTYALDAAREMWAILSENGDPGIYHLSNQGHCSWCEFAAAIMELAGIDHPIAPVPHTTYPTKARRPLWGPIKTIKRSPLRPWKEGLAAFIEEIK